MFIAANVPRIEIGTARLGMMVAEAFRRNTKITRMTRTMAISSVSFTSSMDSRIDFERSNKMPSSIPAGICAWSEGSSL